MKKTDYLIIAAIALLCSAIGYYIGTKQKPEDKSPQTAEIISESSREVAIVKGGPISKAEAQIMYDNFTDKWCGGLKPDKLPQRTRSLWFSFHEIQQYLDTLKKDLGDTSLIGLRLYLGARNESIAGFKYRLTTFIVPTFKLNGIKKDSINDTKINIISPYNHGDLCPPETTCGISIFEGN
ncbi:MAG: hypothetical protein IPK31_11680 [Chitinophagaceae bacterium]|nr:hypothetical protein [Chitinophagaceae bacterium]